MIIKLEILLIGGATRNVGKTTLTCRIIEKFSSNNNIIALKIKTLYEGDSFFHGKDRKPLHENEKFRITEEKDKSGDEDTSKMLRAGAKKVFKIKVKSQFINQAFAEINNRVGEGKAIICESNSLRKEVVPSVFLMIKSENSDKMKPSARKLQKFADKIIYTNGKIHNFELENLEFVNNSWNLRKSD